MADLYFAEAGAPPEALKVPPPTIQQVDSHPDRDFIWAVILETRRACLRREGRPLAIRPYLD